MGKKEYLSEDKVKQLLGGNSEPIRTDSNTVIRLNNGDIVLLLNSKFYDSGNDYWFGISPNILDVVKKNKVTHICFTLGYEGIVKMPIKKVDEYIRYLRQYANDNYHFKIEILDEVYLRTLKKKINLTEFFMFKEDILESDFNTKHRGELEEQAQDYKDDGAHYYDQTGRKRERRENKPQKLRIAILEDYTCQVCKFKQEYTNQNGTKQHIIDIDHIIPKSNDGGEDYHNLWALCPNCHRKKTAGIIKINRENGKIQVTENGEEVDITSQRQNWLSK